MLSSKDVLICGMFFPIHENDIHSMRFNLLKEKYAFDHEDDSIKPSSTSLPSINICPGHPNLIRTTILLDLTGYGHLGQTLQTWQAVTPPDFQLTGP